MRALPFDSIAKATVIRKPGEMDCQIIGWECCAARIVESWEVPGRARLEAAAVRGVHCEM